MKINKLLTVCFALIAGLFQLSANAQGFPAPSVNVISAETQSLSPVAWVSGTVVSPNNSQIAAEVSGRLKSLVELGARVKKGDIIARIDDKTLQLQKRENVASVENAKSRLDYLESEVKRKSTLAKRNLSAITDLDETISQRDVARGDLAAAKARLAQTEQNLEYTQLRAPFDGIVAERLSSQGEYVNNGTAIVRLVETENLEASIFAPLTAYRFLTNAETLAVESPLGNGVAPIKVLVPVANSRSHLMEVRLDMSDFKWPVGLNIKVAVANGESKEVLAVPRDALVLRREGASIFKVNGENKAEEVKVSIGIGAGEMVEIIGNVAPGDRVIVRGAERLRNGQAVSVKESNQNLISGKQ
ncbi:efflux RND transporter periplasmic adaptor subunit [Aliikangiella coralliicola]|uniref:Efflux RND transporter periplasmic adaptor subunit n=1 Tax=Aliikangiella coralliicola TaxID=2592383 RepID=A0A545UFQ7_9GAMM|nr:efflux RND transporter periplasmic adaptor subunit [Aliikangiella coralliicola]TQV88308.1 efflux RND transporter periplasmic adaptor subunit [Aliikangiella coralliicola]